MTEDRFEEFLAEAAPEYNAPPAAPREEMWARIQEARRFQRRVPRRVPQWLVWGTSIAAVLTIGITIGRMSLTQSADEDPTQRTAQTAEEAAPASLPYRLAAIQHMSQAEALITSYRADGASSPEVRRWANDLLSSTRLLLDSPAAEDPNVRKLFEDLELVLVQITQMPARAGSQDRELIDDALEQNNVLPRLRAAVPSGPVRVTT